MELFYVFLAFLVVKIFKFFFLYKIIKCFLYFKDKMFANDSNNSAKSCDGSSEESRSCKCSGGSSTCGCCSSNGSCRCGCSCCQGREHPAK